MATYEWARFNFFDLRTDPDQGKLAQALPEGVIVTSATNGNANVVICDSEGNIHVFSRSWDFVSFKGHDSEIPHCGMSLQNHLLVTLGAEENNTAALFKVWNLAKVNQKGTMQCLRSVKVMNPRPCALGVSENGLFMAIGFQRGNISLYRGDISRDRSKTLKPLVAGTHPIVGIAFKHHDRATYMYVCSDSGVTVFNILSKDRETKLELDHDITELRCCELQMGHSETHFMIGRDDAVYCYTFDGRGPCYVLEGEKQFIKWFRNHLIVVSAHKPAVPSGASVVQSNITVIDITNKFIVFSAQMERIVAVFIEFGTCFIVTEDNVVHHLNEKDLQSKLELLYQRNSFDIAIRIAQSQQLDNDTLAGIYRQHGDHLYNKSQYTAAVEQYILTIGHLEPSYVIRKFLDSRHISHLSTYLQALHEKQVATADHTTLLVNCLTRLNKTVKLEEFFDINTAKDVNFDVEVAANVCRETQAYDQALTLTEKSAKHELHVDILINDLHDSAKACEYIEKLDAINAKECLLKYGPLIMDEQPQETLKLIKHVCRELVDHCQPDDFLFIFADTSEPLLEFLEDVITYTPHCSQLIYDTLIELHLKNQKADTRSKMMNILTNKDMYDKERAMFLCRHYNFWPGLLYLFGEESLSHLIVKSCVQNEDYDELLNCCQRLGANQPSLWLQALMGIRNSTTAPVGLIQKILSVINNEKLLSPLQVLSALAVENGPTLGAVNDFFMRAFRKEMESKRVEEEVIRDYQEQSDALRAQIIATQEEPLEFRGSICDACRQPLTLPSIHFHCLHSFHLDCIRCFSETDRQCTVCADENEKIIRMLKEQSSMNIDHDVFQEQLNKSTETFSVISEYLGRGLFNKILLIDEGMSLDQPVKTKITPIRSTAERATPPPTAATTMNKRVDDITSILAKTEGLRDSPKHSPKASPLPSRLATKPSTSGSSGSLSRAVVKNPFDDEEEATEATDYDPKKNPFEEYDDAKNPFAGDDNDSYDSNLNPFS